MIFLALKYLIERRRQTLLTLLGVFLGTTAYVGVSGFFLGFQGFLVDQLVNNSAQVHIQARQDYLTEHLLDIPFYGSGVEHVFWAPAPSGVIGFLEVQNPQSWYARLAADPRVEAFSPLMNAPALFNVAKISVSANLIGCDPLQQMHVTSIADYMVEGSFAEIANGGHRVILGNELKNRLGVSINQTVLVSVSTQAPVPFKVVGFFNSGNRGLDLQAYGSLGDVQKLNRTPNRVTEIGVKLKDYTQAAALASSWSMIAPERTESWDQQNVNVFSVFRLQNTLRYSMIVAILVVAGFGIYNVLNMTVNQKRQDVAILRSMGYDTFDIVMLFFLQGFILGVSGACLGLLCGYGLCRFLQTIPFMSPMGGNPSGHLLISLSWTIYAQAAALALLSSSFASILPARAAGKLTPIDIIRSGG